MICQVPPEMLDQYWPIAHVLLAPAMRMYGRAEMGPDVRRAIEARKALLWMWVEPDEQPTCAMVLEPDYDYLNIWLVGGRAIWRERLDTWLDAVFRYAREQEYRGVRCTTRKGIAHILKARGWHSAAEQVEIDVWAAADRKPRQPR